jgi:hypothetical protein
MTPVENFLQDLPRTPYCAAKCGVGVVGVFQQRIEAAQCSGNEVNLES